MGRKNTGECLSGNSSSTSTEVASDMEISSVVPFTKMVVEGAVILDEYLR